MLPPSTSWNSNWKSVSVCDYSALFRTRIFKFRTPPPSEITTKSADGQGCVVNLIASENESQSHKTYLFTRMKILKVQVISCPSACLLIIVIGVKSFFVIELMYYSFRAFSVSNLFCRKRGEEKEHPTCRDFLYKEWYFGNVARYARIYSPISISLCSVSEYTSWSDTKSQRIIRMPLHSSYKFYYYKRFTRNSDSN